VRSRGLAVRPSFGYRRGHALRVDLDPADGATREDAHEQVYALVSTIAEPTTVIVETREEGAAIFDVSLAVTPKQSTFPKGHGHPVRLRVHTA
jgi:hypothetical protein